MRTMDMGNSLARGQDAGVRQTVIVSAADACGRQRRTATATATATAKALALRGAGGGPGWCGMARDAVNPSMGAWSRHPCRSHPCHPTPPRPRQVHEAERMAKAKARAVSDVGWRRNVEPSPCSAGGFAESSRAWARLYKERQAKQLLILFFLFRGWTQPETVRGRAGGLGRGVRGMDAAAKPPWMGSRRPLPSPPARPSAAFASRTPTHEGLRRSREPTPKAQASAAAG